MKVKEFNLSEKIWFEEKNGKDNGDISIEDVHINFTPYYYLLLITINYYLFTINLSPASLVRKMVIKVENG